MQIIEVLKQLLSDSVNASGVGGVSTLLLTNIVTGNPIQVEIITIIGLVLLSNHAMKWWKMVRIDTPKADKELKNEHTSTKDNTDS